MLHEEVESDSDIVVTDDGIVIEEEHDINAGERVERGVALAGEPAGPRHNCPRR